MPLAGTLDVAAAAAAAPLVQGLTSPAWALPGAELLQLSYEVAEDPALGLAPPGLHPTIPPYATFSVLRAPESPVGPFLLAQVRLVVRSGVRPRALLLGAVTDSADAARGLAAGWGFPAQVGEVALTVRNDRVMARVSLAGRPVLAAELEDPMVIGGADVNLIDSLHLVRLEEDGAVHPALLQVDPEYVFRSAQRGRPRLAVFDAEGWGVGGRLVPTHPITALYAEVDTDLPQVRFVLDPEVPSMSGGARRVGA